jgi:hypothetical protein
MVRNARECLTWLKTRKSQTEHISSGLSPRADVEADTPISSRWGQYQTPAEAIGERT